MPLGNGEPRGLPSAPASVLTSPVRYDTPHVAAGDTGFNPITKPTLWTPSLYERVIAATPGLAQWYPLGYAPGGYSYFTYGNAAGANTLEASGSGTDKVVPGLAPGSRAQAVQLAGGRYLWSEDYLCWPMGWETIMAVEFWVYFSALGNDSAILGEWDSGSGGWMIYCTSGELRMYSGTNHLDHAAAFTTGKTYHVVCCWGGSGSPTTDYVSRAYVNGVEILNGNLVVSGNTVTTSAHFQINAYSSSDGGGSGKHDMTLQHISIYNRMLQPLEVQQHYQAGFARG